MAAQDRDLNLCTVLQAERNSSWSLHPVATCGAGRAPFEGLGYQSRARAIGSWFEAAQAGWEEPRGSSWTTHEEDAPPGSRPTAHCSERADRCSWCHALGFAERSVVEVVSATLVGGIEVAEVLRRRRQ